MNEISIKFEEANIYNIISLTTGPQAKEGREGGGARERDWL